MLALAAPFSIAPTGGGRPGSLARCLLLALLLHIWALLMLGNAPGGRAVPGWGVGGSLDIRLGLPDGNLPDRAAADLPPPAGPPGTANTPRQGGVVRPEAAPPAADPTPGSARTGDWRDTAAEQLRGPDASPLPAAPALRLMRPAPPGAPTPFFAPQLALDAVAPPPPALSELPSPQQVAPAPVLGTLPKAVPRVSTAVAPEMPALAALPALPALPSVTPAAALPIALAAPTTAPLAPPPLVPAPVEPMPPPAMAPAPPLAPAVAPPRAPTAESAPATVGAPVTQTTTASAAPPGEIPRLSSSAPPGATAGAPDAGALQGQDVATPPSAAANPPRLNLDLPRLRGGPLSRQALPGVLPLLPRPPELQTQLEKDIEKAARADCRSAHSGAGVLAVVPLVKDALTGKGCRW